MSHTQQATYPPQLNKIPISLLKVGDTVIHNGEMITVSKSNLKYDSFMGHSFRGDNYMCGHVPVTLVVFPSFYRGVQSNPHYIER